MVIVALFQDMFSIMMGCLLNLFLDLRNTELEAEVF